MYRLIKFMTFVH